MSKPAWSGTTGSATMPASFLAFDVAWRTQPPRTIPMTQTDSAMAQQIAQAASAFEERLTGRQPTSVTVVLIEETLVITMHGALSPAEKALALTPEGAAYVQEF